MHQVVAEVVVSALKVLLVDEQSIVRRGCRSILESESGIRVVDEAASADEAIAKAHIHHPQVIVLDPAMPGGSGAEIIRRIAAELPHTRVLVLTKHEESAFVRNVLLAGATGYLLKTARDEDFVEAVRSVGVGRSYLSPSVSDAVLGDYRRHVTSPLELLTAREREVLILLAEGRTNKEVAAQLNLSVHTVDAHRGKLMDKLDLHNVGDIVRFSMRHGVIC